MGNCLGKKEDQDSTGEENTPENNIPETKPTEETMDITTGNETGSNTTTGNETPSGSNETLSEPIKTKKAILIGLNYTGTTAELEGCINDAMEMFKTLKMRFDYHDVTVLTDKEITVQKNIDRILDELVSSKHHNLFFQYSGHGTQVIDYNNDEPDYLDETLYSVYDTLITDDQINDIIKKVPENTNLVIVIDACHSGTMIDLPFQLDGDKVVRINENNIKGNVISISGCRDDQVSMDVRSDKTAYGAMSNCLQKTLTKIGPETTWKELVLILRDELEKEEFAQIPQLCVSKAELINSIVDL